MSDLLYETQDNLGLITLNRVAKHNAFDKHLLVELQAQFQAASSDERLRVIILKANGTHFSSGADLGWMQEMLHFSKEENLKDALVLGKLMHTINQSPKPTLAMVQGSAFGGGAGLAAACDVAIAAADARFCFSEVKLGLIPAVISPYVVQAIGERHAKDLFMSAEIIDAPKALTINLIQHCVPQENLWEFTLKHALKIASNAPKAVSAAKKLVAYVANKKIDEDLVYYTASLIAQKRVSAEGQEGLMAFLNKKTPDWN